VICVPVRTAVGRYGGMFRDVPAPELAATVIRAVVERAGVTPDAIDDVILGQCYPNGEAPAIGRVAALDAGLPETVPGIQIDRRCGSGLQAVIDAAMRIQCGADELIIAGGVESMSNAEYYTTQMRWGARGEHQLMFDRLARGRTTAGGFNHPVPGGMIETAENLRREHGISRGDQDELALASHQRAVEAIERGRFSDEIVPVTVRDRRGEATELDRDEHPRVTTLDALAQLRPMMIAADPEATVTAGNASGQNDGAAVCIVTSFERAASLRLQPLARLVSWALAGVPPRTMGMGPVPATERALAKAELTLSDVDLIELNEAFASQVLACTRAMGLGQNDMERVNVNGSGISLGHPVGATGARILATLLGEMQRRDARFGLETMCIGGGQGLSAVFERVSP
jgi:acetyl-CoA C-acetyltransferase